MGRVFKYRANSSLNMDGEKLDIAILRNAELFASKIDTLNDPFEASAELPNEPKNDYWVTPIIQDIGSVGIYSLSKPMEGVSYPCNELLWAHYGNSHKGFCIEYDLDTLTSYVSLEFDISDLIHVHYEEERPIVLEKDSIFDIRRKVFGTKSLAWQYENEVRLVFNSSGCKPIPKGSITAIYFGLYFGLESRKEIMNILRDKNVAFYQMERVDNLYKLKATKLELDYSYEIITKEVLPKVDNYLIYYKSKNKDRYTLSDFVSIFRQKLSRPSNLTIIDDMEAKELLRSYKPRNHMSLKEIEIMSKHWIAYSSFDAPDMVWYYPEK